MPKRDQAVDENVAQFQKRSQDAVAPRTHVGTHRTGYSGYRSEPPKMNDKGPVSKILRKRTFRLNARLRDWASTQNNASAKSKEAYRKPGSMR